MQTFAEQMRVYRSELQQGMIQQAYRGLMEYMQQLRAHFATNYPDYAVSGSLYPGYMDMTYFAVVPPALARRKLKVAVVFVHEACRFELWLSGVNRQVQARFRQLMLESDWSKHPIVAAAENVDAIVAAMAVADPDFNDLDVLTRQIEKATKKFIVDIEAFLAGSGADLNRQVTAADRPSGRRS